ncbi:MAG: GtrA family protein [Bacteroidaceae bacterium]|nr:GtrA family protein [Bacteroidaceae bacterium]
MIEKFINYKDVPQFIRFCVVGGICAIIDAVVYYVVDLFTPYQVALISGYLISFCINYFLTINWTFKTVPSVRNFEGFVGAHMFNLFVVRMGLMWLFVEKIGMDDTIAYIPMAFISAISNFLVVRAVINFSKKDKSSV